MNDLNFDCGIPGLVYTLFHVLQTLPKYNLRNRSPSDMKPSVNII